MSTTLIKTSEGNVLGWRYDLEDMGSLRAKGVGDAWKAAVKGADNADEVDPESWLLRTDQLQQGACQGFTLATAGMYNSYLATGELEMYSQQFAYIMTQTRDGLLGRDQGSTIENGENSAEEDGFLPYKWWEYTGKYHTTPPGRSMAECKGEAKRRLIQTTATIQNAEDADLFIGTGLGPISIGITWNDSVNRGKVDSFDYNRGGGGHALLICGKTRKFEDSKGRPYFKIANWWYKTWGYNGYGYWSWDALNQMFKGRYTVARGLSDLAGDAIKPRKMSWGEYKYTPKYSRRSSKSQGA